MTVSPKANAETSPDESLALVSALAEGDAEALSVLYDRYAPTLLALAHRMLGNPQEAEDLLRVVRACAPPAELQNITPRVQAMQATVAKED